MKGKTEKGEKEYPQSEETRSWKQLQVLILILDIIYIWHYTHMSYVCVYIYKILNIASWQVRDGEATKKKLIFSYAFEKR